MNERERAEGEDRFRDYMNEEYATLPQDWTPEKKFDHAAFDYFHESHRAETFHNIYTPLERAGNFIARARELPGVGGAIGALQDRMSNLAERNSQSRLRRVVSVGGRVLQEGAITGGAAVATRSLLANVLPALNVAGAGVAYGASIGAGIVAGGVGAYRGAGEQVTRKNFGAEKLLNDLKTEELIQKHALFREEMKNRPEVEYSPDRVIDGMELNKEYFAEVAKAVATLREVIKQRQLRGDRQDRELLADRLAYLQGILEEQAFFQEKVKRDSLLYSDRTLYPLVTPAPPAPGAAAPPPFRVRGDVVPGIQTMDQQAGLFVDILEYRMNNSLTERFATGINEDVKKVVGDTKKLARAASRKAMVRGAIVGGLAGATFQGIRDSVHAYFASHPELYQEYIHPIAERAHALTEPIRRMVPEQLKHVLGFGGSEIDPERAQLHAITNEPDYKSITNHLDTLSEQMQHGSVDITDVTNPANPADGLRIRADIAQNPVSISEYTQQYQHADAIDKLLKKHNLGGFSQYGLPGGGNALTELAEQINGDPSFMEQALRQTGGSQMGADALAEQLRNKALNEAAYNVLSHWDHLPTTYAEQGWTLDEWHRHLMGQDVTINGTNVAGLSIDQVRDVHTPDLDLARETYLKDLRTRHPDWFIPAHEVTVPRGQGTIEAARDFEHTIRSEGIEEAMNSSLLSPVYNNDMIGPLVGGAGGYIAGHVEAGKSKPVNLSEKVGTPHTPEAEKITPEKWADKGKREPRTGDVWEIRAGAVDKSGKRLFSTHLAASGALLKARITEIVGPEVRFELVPPLKKGITTKDKEFTVKVHDMFKSNGFTVEATGSTTAKKRAAGPAETVPRVDPRIKPKEWAEERIKENKEFKIDIQPTEITATGGIIGTHTLPAAGGAPALTVDVPLYNPIAEAVDKTSSVRFKIANINVTPEENYHLMKFHDEKTLVPTPNEKARLKVKPKPTIHYTAAGDPILEVIVTGVTTT